jgi:uncharacterized protein
VTIDAQIEALESLAAIDADLALLLEQLGREKESIRQKRERLEELGKRVATGKGSVAEMERTRSDVSVEMRQMNSQIERSREKMTRCRNEKETMAVQRELEELRKLVRDREIDVERLGQLLDQARADVTTAETEHDKIQADIGEVEGPALEKIRELETDTADRGSRRKVILVKVGPQILSRYEMIRRRRGSALAHTTDGTCSACHISLPPMMFQQLMRREQLGQCPQCNRILYYRVVSMVPPPPHAEPES